MKFALVLACAAAALTVSASEPKPVPNQAANDYIDLQGTVLLMPADIRQALGGNDLAGPNVDAGTIAVRIKVTPKSAKGLRVSPEDFTLLSRKNGERDPSLSPEQVAGGGSVLVLRQAAEQPGGDGTTVSGPVWGGISKRKTGSGPDKAPLVKRGDSSNSPLIPILKQYGLPDQEIKAPEEGLLYFTVSGKLKPKDLSLIYEGGAGKLVVDFK